MGRKDDNKDVIKNEPQKSNDEEVNKENHESTGESVKDSINGENNDKEVTDEKKEIVKDEVSKEEYNNQGINNNEKRNKKQKKIYIGIISFFVLLGIIYFAAKRYDNLVYPNITLYEEDLSKLNEKELNEKVNTLVNKINSNKVTVKIDGKEYNILVKDVIETLDRKKVENEIMNYGKNKTFLEQFGLIYLGVGRNYNFNIKIDNDAIQNKVMEIYDDTKVAAVEPTIEMNGDKLEIIKGKNGKDIDEEALVDEIIDKINSDQIVNTNIVISTEYKALKPKISYEDLKGVNYKISSATTYFGGTGYNRGLNIANAAKKVDGTLLMPGEEFSYEDTVSPVELSNGYYMAPVIVNGTHKNAPGGGVCQVSTTLYNAELKAGILPTERYNHSKSVSYVQRGLDATLATGSKNLKFKNPYDYPVYIHAYTVGGQITVEFWSNKSVLDGKKYTPVSFVKGNVANTYLYCYNSKGELIYKKFIDTSIYR